MSRMRMNQKSDGLLMALALSLAFMVASYLRVIGDAGSAALGGTVLNTIMAQPIWGTRLGNELAKFAGAVVLLHTLLAIACWGLARVTLKAWPGSGSSQRALTVLWFALLTTWILAANAYQFPGTSLGGFYHQITRIEVGSIPAFHLLTVALMAAVSITLALAAARCYGSFVRSQHAWIGVALLSASVAVPAITTVGNGGKAFDRPHVILVGIDSLRADFVQNELDHWTPSIDEFLTDSVYFANAYTPLARTFPAWISIISGRHPHTTGAFVNLLPRKQINEGTTMPARLASSGYQTAYAIDEVRFSNLDESYGFDRTLTPPMGAADFLLGFFADTPLSNITVNTGLGKILLPYAYANRAASNTYNPDTFIDRIESGIDFNRPTLLAVHMTLAHWPFTWADSTEPESEGVSAQRDPAEIARSRYETAIRRVDQQFGRLMAVLKAKGALENAIVVVLSDHGESLGEPSPIAAADGEPDPVIRTTAVFGHGTHVLSADQYHVVLGVRAFGNSLIPAEHKTVLTFPVSLEDITPTILDALDLDQGISFDGRSLLPYMGKGGDSLAGIQDRIRFLETEFNPPGISTETMPSASALAAAAGKYRIDPVSGRMLVRTAFLDEILEQRQYAVERGGDMLVTFPATGNRRQQYLLHYNARTDIPVWLDKPPTAASNPELYLLWEALAQRFAAVRERPVIPSPALAPASVVASNR
jgi:arylsulfatase A-like enzyme